MSVAAPERPSSGGAAPLSPDAGAADENLSELEKLEKYVQGPIPLQRLVYVKRITDAARESGFVDTKARISPLIPKIIVDPEHVIRQAFALEAQNLSNLLLSLPEQKESYALFCEAVVPSLHSLLVDPNAEVRDASSQSLLALAALVRKEDLDSFYIKKAISLLKETSDDEAKTSVITFLNELSVIAGADSTKSLIVPVLVDYSKSDSFRLRKACAQNFGSISGVVGTPFVLSSLLGPFEALASDPIWSVRKGCVESMVDVAHSVDRATRASVFVPMMHKFVKDVSRWVRNAAYKALGPFLHILEEDLITPELLGLFTGIPSLSYSLVDNEVNFFCAYNFPAVVQRLGPSRWPELLPTYQILTKDTKFKVRRTLSYSLHEIAAVLGTELTEEYLLPTFDLFLKDLDEVRVGVISGLAQFLRVLKPETRLIHLDILRDVQRESDQNWRFRELLSRQLPILAEIYSKDILSTEIVPLMLGLCRDRIAAVRNIAVQTVGCFLIALAGEPAYPELLQEIHLFAMSDTFMERQLYLRICEGLERSVKHELFASDFVPLLMSLAKDQVVNVRISLAKLLASRFLSSESWKSNTKVLAATYILSKDTSKDVRFALKSYDSLEELNKKLSDKEAEEQLKFVLGYEINVSSSSLNKLLLSRKADMESKESVSSGVSGTLGSPPAMPRMTDMS